MERRRLSQCIDHVDRLLAVDLCRNSRDTLLKSMYRMEDSNISTPETRLAVMRYDRSYETHIHNLCSYLQQLLPLVDPTIQQSTYPYLYSSSRLSSLLRNEASEGGEASHVLEPKCLNRPGQRFMILVLFVAVKSCFAPSITSIIKALYGS